MDHVRRVDDDRPAKLEPRALYLYVVLGDWDVQLLRLLEDAGPNVVLALGHITIVGSLVFDRILELEGLEIGRRNLECGIKAAHYDEQSEEHFDFCHSAPSGRGATAV